MSRVACFPHPIDGELLYGLLARHRHMAGSAPAAVHSDELFGRSAAVATFDLPGGLARLAGNLPVASGLGVGQLLARTMYPYYAAHQPDEVRAVAAGELCTGTAPAAHNRLGVNAFAIRPFEALRFCPQCIGEQVAGFGEGTWLAAHQAPGVVVCTRHGCLVETSGVTRPVAGRHGYLRPQRGLRDMRSRDAPTGLTGTRLDVIAADTAALWTAPPDPVPLRDRRDAYRTRLDAIGLMRSPGKVDLRGLVGAFRAYWGPALGHLPDACQIGDYGGWLAAIVRTHRKAFHPLLHVMFDRFLLDADVVPADAGPFGTGPWSCRNVLADHHGEPVAMTLAMHRERYGRVGTFACLCGYSYTRAARDDGVIGPPRLAAAGPLLAPALRRLVVPGAKLRAVARAVGLDPKTVVREALALGLAIPWTTKPSGGPPTAQVARASPPTRRRTRRRHARRDWAAYDRDLARRLRNAHSDIVSADPPVRAGRAELERRVARSGYFAKRKEKLPRSTAMIGRLAEGVETFQRRRIRYWAARPGADVRPWRVARVAGLRGELIGMVRRELGGSD